MLTKEIKRKEYMKGTKALRLRNIIGVGCVIITTIISIPTYKYFAKTINVESNKESREAYEKRKIQEMFELRATLEDHQPDIKALVKGPTRPTR